MISKIEGTTLHSSEYSLSSQFKSGGDRNFASSRHFYSGTLMKPTPNQSQFYTTITSPAPFPLPRPPGRSPLATDRYGSAPDSSDAISEHAEWIHASSTTLLANSTDVMSTPSLDSVESSRDHDKRKSLMAENLDLKSQLQDLLKRLKVLDTENFKLGAKYDAIKTLLETIESEVSNKDTEYKELKKSYNQKCNQLCQLENNHQRVLDHLDTVLQEQSSHANKRIALQKEKVWPGAHPTCTEDTSQVRSLKIDWIQPKHNDDDDDDENKHRNSRKKGRVVRLETPVETAPSSKTKVKVRAISTQVDPMEASVLPGELERLLQENLELHTLLENLRARVESGAQGNPFDVRAPSLMHELDLAEKVHVHCGIQTNSEETLTFTSGPFAAMAEQKSPQRETYTSPPSISHTAHEAPPFVPTKFPLSPTTTASASILERRASKYTGQQPPSTQTLPRQLSIQIPVPQPQDIQPFLFRKLNRFVSRPQPRYCWVYQLTLFWSRSTPFNNKNHTVHARAVQIIGVEETQTRFGLALVILSPQRHVHLLADDLELHENWKSKLNQLLEPRNSLVRF